MTACDSHGRCRCGSDFMKNVDREDVSGLGNVFPQPQRFCCLHSCHSLPSIATVDVRKI